MSVPSGRSRALAGALVAAGILAAGILVSPTTVLETADAVAGEPLAFGLIVAGLYLVRPLLAWPTTPLAAVVGYGFGVVAGVPIALVGVITTVLPVFVAVRWLTGDGTATAPGGGGLLERAGGTVACYYETTGPLRGVIASRLAPIPSDVATCAAAVSDVDLRHLIVGTAIGELPWTTAAVIVGASAATVSSSGLGELGFTLSVGCAAAAGLLLAGPLYRAIRDRRTDGSTRATDG